MKQLPEALRDRVKSLLQLLVEKIIVFRQKITSKNEIAREETATESNPSIHQSSKLGTVKKILLNSRHLNSQTQPFKKASLFPDGKTSIAAMSLLLHGVAEVLSQKRDLPWNTKSEKNLGYEKATDGKKGAICYYVTDNRENLSPETISEEAALAVIDRFDPRAGAIHLIYCAAAANLNNPWESEFLLDDKQLLEYTGLIKRRDLCIHEKLTILYDLVRQPAQILAHIAWEKQGKIGAFTVADLKIWNVNVARDFETDKAGDRKLTGLKVIVQPGVWAKYFLNKSEYYYYTGVITKKIVQTLFSIGKQNAGAARMLIWLTFQVKPGCREVYSGKSLMEVAYGAAKIAVAEQDRQLRRQLADDLATDLKVIEAAEWRVEVETGPAWLTNKDGAKRPIGFWNQLLETRWRFELPEAALADTTKPTNKLRGVESPKQQPPSGAAIREARKAKGWSRAFFAATMGKSVSWVDAIETDHRQVAQRDLPNLLEKLEMKS